MCSLWVGVRTCSAERHVILFNRLTFTNKPSVTKLSNLNNIIIELMLEACYPFRMPFKIFLIKENALQRHSRVIRHPICCFTSFFSILDATVVPCLQSWYSATHFREDGTAVSVFEVFSKRIAQGTPHMARRHRGQFTLNPSAGLCETCAT